MNNVLTLPGRIIGFFRGVISEMKLVEFPSRKETFKGTHLVIAVSIVASAFLLLADGLFTFIRNFIIESI